MTTFSYDGMSAQRYNITQTGYYTIQVDGAQGGASSDGTVGGLGAQASGTFLLTAGSSLRILVGGEGVAGSSEGGGGGGASFVESTNPGITFLVVAGGGGGSADGGVTGGKGLAFTSGTGTGGAAGTQPNGFEADVGGSGGGGFGGDGESEGGNGSTGGVELQSTATGGNGNAFGGGAGGYGGGGGAGNGGGGGGGYDGGNGGSISAVASTGGDSYVKSTAVAESAASGVESGDGSVTITLVSVTCFAAGTLIRIAREGAEIEVAVEELAVGDLAVTAFGERRPIRWIGCRTLRGGDHPDPRKVWPYRVAAGALNANVPARDLWLSPEHALRIDGVLVPVRALAHPGRIEQVEVAEITYWHIELDSHDILVAEGAPAESYLDTGNRTFFDAGGSAEMRPEKPSTAGFCCPFVESGPLLSRVRARLFAERPKTKPERTGLHLVADGRVLVPHLANGAATFLLPPDADEVRMCSPTFRTGGSDVRTLGVLVSSITVEMDDGGPRAIRLDDPALFAGFHNVQSSGDASWRWTNGDGHLASDLWAGAVGGVLIRISGEFDPTRKPVEPPARDAA